MRYLALIDVILWALFYWAYRSADRPGDDFGAAFPALVLLALAVVCAVALVVWAIIHGAMS